MGTFYTIVFTPEEASKWMAYEDNEGLGVTENVQYEVYSETVDGRLMYYIINDREEKAYDIWKKTRGDFVALY